MTKYSRNEMYIVTKQDYSLEGEPDTIRGTFLTKEHAEEYACYIEGTVDDWYDGCYELKWDRWKKEAIPFDNKGKD